LAGRNGYSCSTNLKLYDFAEDFREAKADHSESHCASALPAAAYKNI